MPRKPSRFIKDLTGGDLRELKYYIEQGETPRIRHRAHAIRLSYQGKTISEIAEIFSVDRDTVSNWLDRWDQSKVKGLADKPRAGAAPILDDSERELVLDLWETYHSPKKVLDELERRLEKRISVSTLKRTVRASSSHRPRKPRRHEQPIHGLRGMSGPAVWSDCDRELITF